MYEALDSIPSIVKKRGDCFEILFNSIIFLLTILLVYNNSFKRPDYWTYWQIRQRRSKFKMSEHRRFSCIHAQELSQKMVTCTFKHDHDNSKNKSNWYFSQNIILLTLPRSYKTTKIMINIITRKKGVKDFTLQILAFTRKSSINVGVLSIAVFIYSRAIDG